MNSPFHLYGFIVGIVIVTAITLIEKQYKKLEFSENNFWKIIIFSLIFGVIGARLWHVATDFYLYENNLREVFYIWNGGLSIFGGILGGVVGVYFSLKLFQNCRLLKSKGTNKKIQFLEFLDIAIFGLPIGQVIGRLGNYVNQELYGKPVSDFGSNSIFSIFKIFISPENRLLGYENIEYYHPIFFYEMVAMVFFVGAIYYFNLKKKLPKIGTGKLFLIYVLYYSIVRFLLDFIRLDKTMIGWLNIGVNQVILLIFVMISVHLLFKKRKLVLTSIYVFIATLILIMFNFNKTDKQSQKLFKDTVDRELVSIMVGDETKLKVEIVNSVESTQQGLSGRDEIGNDGMLFIFPESSMRTFWMFDMKFDLDFVWINGDEVVGLSKNIKKPAPGTINKDIERVSIKKDSNKVLELNAGNIDKYNIEVGDVVILK